MTFGEELRAIRTRLGLSLQAVEDKSEGRWKNVVVGSWEREDRRTTVQQARRLLDFYSELSGGTYRLSLMHPGDVVYRAAAPFGGEVRYVVDAPGIRIDCADLAEADRIAGAMPGSRVGHRLVGPVTYETRNGEQA